MIRQRAEAQHRMERRRIPVKYLVPNIITATSLCSGLASLHFSINMDYDRSLMALALAAVIDALDGRAARLLHVTSRFGAVLDSLADFLSFGVAPALLIYQWMLKGEGILGLAAMMTYVVCAALRLARFTSQTSHPDRTDPIQARFFTGLPTPAAAGAVLAPVMVSLSRKIESLGDWEKGLDSAATARWFVIGYSFFIAWLMVSRVPMFSFKKIRVSRRYVPLLMVIVAMTFAFAIWDFWLAVASLAAAFLLSTGWSVAAHRRMKRALPPAGDNATAPSMSEEVSFREHA